MATNSAPEQNPPCCPSLRLLKMEKREIKRRMAVVMKVNRAVVVKRKLMMTEIARPRKRSSSNSHKPKAKSSLIL